MKEPTPRRQVTADERIAIQCLGTVSYPVASWDKRFARSMAGMETITEKEAPQVWRLFIRYRRQFFHPEKARLLALAEKLSAPDLRKQAALQHEQARYLQAMKPQP